MKKKAVPLSATPVDPDIQAAEAALLRRAVGYTVTETRTTEGGKTLGGEKQTVTTQKQVPPDVRALIFFLKNRVPDKWREKEKMGEGEALAVGEDPFVAALKVAAERVWGQGDARGLSAPWTPDQRD